MNVSDKKPTESLNKKFKCDQCDTQFSSLANLVNHKKKVCLKAIKPSNQDIPLEIEGIHFKTEKKDIVSQSIDEQQRQISNKNKVLEDLYNYKSKKSIEQSVRDIEDLIIRDTIRYRQLNAAVDTGDYQYQQILKEVYKFESH
jgi:hypothetical protein